MHNHGTKFGSSPCMKVQVLLPDVGALSSVVFLICCSISVGSVTNCDFYLFIVVWSFCVQDYETCV